MNFWTYLDQNASGIFVLGGLACFLAATVIDRAFRRSVAARESARAWAEAKGLRDKSVPACTCGKAFTSSSSCPECVRLWCTSAKTEGADEAVSKIVKMLQGRRTPGGEAITSAAHAAVVIARGDWHSFEGGSK